MFFQKNSNIISKLFQTLFKKCFKYYSKIFQIFFQNFTIYFSKISKRNFENSPNIWLKIPQSLFLITHSLLLTPYSLFLNILLLSKPPQLELDSEAAPSCFLLLRKYCPDKNHSHILLSHFHDQSQVPFRQAHLCASLGTFQGSVGGLVWLLWLFF